MGGWGRSRSVAGITRRPSQRERTGKGDLSLRKYVVGGGGGVGVVVGVVVDVVGVVVGVGVIGVC